MPGLTKSELQEFIRRELGVHLGDIQTQVRDNLKELIGEQVGTALAPFKEQQTNWMQQILSNQHRGPEKPLEAGIGAARYIRSVVAARGDPDRAVRWATQEWGAESEVVKQLAASNATAGGFIVPPGYTTEIIELLRPASVVRSLNPIIWPMVNGTANPPKLTGGSTAGYVGENQNIGVTQPQFGSLALSAKKLAAIVPISNDLIRFSNPSADTIVRDDLVAALAQRQDLAFIRGDGLQNTPRGLRNWIVVANIIPTAGVAPVTLAQMTTDLSLAMLALQNNNVRMLRPGWIMAPRTAMSLMTIRDGNGNYAFRDEMLRGTLWGFPYRTTTQIPINLAPGTATELYFADFMDVVIGESVSLIIDASTEAAYFDGTAVQAAFSRDQTVIRAIEEHDFGLRHDESASVITGVLY